MLYKPNQHFEVLRHRPLNVKDYNNRITTKNTVLKLAFRENSVASAVCSGWLWSFISHTSDWKYWGTNPTLKFHSTLRDRARQWPILYKLTEAFRWGSRDTGVWSHTDTLWKCCYYRPVFCHSFLYRFKLWKLAVRGLGDRWGSLLSVWIKTWCNPAQDI